MQRGFRKAGGVENRLGYRVGQQGAEATFYRKLCAELERSCGIPPTDVMVSIVENADSDWSFGLGSGQFLTGELRGSGPSASPSGPSR